MSQMQPAPQPQISKEIVPYTQSWPLGQWGFKVMLLGDTGGGKSYSIITLAKAGLEVFILYTENGMAAINKALSEIPAGEREILSSRIHWHYIKPAPFDITASKTMLDTMSKMQSAQMSSLLDSNKAKYNQLVEVYACMANFYCQRSKKYYGMVDSWGTDRVFVIDSLSGLSLMALYLIIGGKPGTHEGEWGMAMGQVEKLINAMCLAVPTNFVLLSHLEREPSPLDGAMKLSASTLGKKLAPKLPRYFDEVAVAFREGTTWWWSTNYANADTKSRTLGFKDKMPPSFVPLVETLRAQGNATA